MGGLADGHAGGVLDGVSGDGFLGGLGRATTEAGDASAGAGLDGDQVGGLGVRNTNAFSLAFDVRGVLLDTGSETLLLLGLGDGSGSLGDGRGGLGLSDGGGGVNTGGEKGNGSELHFD